MVKSASAELTDNIFVYWAQTNTETFTIENTRQQTARLNPNTRALASVTVRLDSQSQLTGREADTFFNGLESIGGFSESLIHLCTWFVFFFQERLFVSSFIRQLYQVDAEKIPDTVKLPHHSKMILEAQSADKIDEPYL